MAGHGGKKKRRGHGDHESEHPDERWLVSYADMITLLMAMFLVMWSMASVNTSKFESLAASLREAFSGKILPGGEAALQPGNQSAAEKAAPTPPIPTITPVTSPEASAQTPNQAQGVGDGRRSDAAQKEAEDLERLKREIDAYAEARGLDTQVKTTVARRGLVVTVLTDKVLFASGSADVKPEAGSLLDALARLLKTQVRNPIQVEGNTDNVPVSGRFPTNWELSTARATAIVRKLIGRGVNPDRLAATGYADRHPIATNATEAGRRANRRVELVVLRTQAEAGHGGQETTQGGTGK
jgi:chemotaxis protein MotB